MSKSIVPQLITPVKIYPHRPYKEDKSRISGWYLELENLFVPNIGQEIDRIQYIGVHTSLILTIVKPTNAKSLIELAIDLNKLPERGKITWIGCIKCYPAGKGCRYYIPAKIWNPNFESTWRSSADIYWWATCDENYPYLLAEVPTITRETLRRT